MPLQYPKPIMNAVNSKMNRLFDDFIYATQHGFLGNMNTIIDHVYELITDSDRKLWFDVSLYALQISAEFGHVDGVKCITERRPSGDKANIILAYRAAMRKAAQNGHKEVVDHMLDYDEVLYYADIHAPLFDNYLHQLISQQLAKLREQEEHFLSIKPRGIFNIKETEFLYYVYILINLIRRNDSELIPHIRKLLTLPLLVNKLDEYNVCIGDGRSNYVYRFSLEIHNEAASIALLELPNVHQSARLNEFYIDGARDAEEGLSMRSTVRNKESSMRELQPGEQRIIDLVKAHYNLTMLENGGTKTVFNTLKTYLKDKYNEMPATAIVKGLATPLPFEWSDFCKMTLSVDEKILALQAYYKHISHTAHRFLSTPNPWITSKPDFWISRDQTGRYADYVKHTDLIAYFWLAINDNKVPATDGQTIAGRREFFINSLALLGRAKNWNKPPRHKKNISGELMYDAELHEVREEYDDLCSDHPSCEMGILRRIFYAITGHPLFVHLTMHLLENELNERIRSYYETLISKQTPEQKRVINQEITKATIFMEQPSDHLKILNIPSSQKQAWIDELSIKYGLEFDDTAEFLAYIYRQLDITPDQAHITQFSILHEPRPLIEPLPLDIPDSALVILPSPLEIVIAVPIPRYHERFSALSTPGIILLDLSASNLSKLTPIEIEGLFRQLSYIPKTITTISFRGNGFQNTDATTISAYLAFTKALCYIPNHITTLYLSDNGFEFFTHEQLQALFLTTPRTVKSVCLVDGEPLLSITDHIERINWPQSFNNMAVKGLGNFMKIAHEILNDYTKDDSQLLRIVTFHWNRHYTTQVAAIVERIGIKPTTKSISLYRDNEELIADLARINIANHSGSLATRYTFLARHPTRRETTDASPNISVELEI